MRIHTDSNNVYVNAIPQLSGGEDVEGHLYIAQHGASCTTLGFQRGGVAQNGVNGITNECLLAVVAHRIKYLDGKFPCVENKLALEHTLSALQVLEARTAARQARGVEGKEVA